MKKIIIFLIIFIIIVSGIIIIKNDNRSSKITIINKNSIIDVNDFIIKGEATKKNVNVYLNNEKIDNIAATDYFEYKVNPELLIDGWNYIEFRIGGFLGTGDTRTGGAINNIKNQPDVFIPDNIIKIAREFNLKHRDKYVLDSDYDYNKNYIGAGNLEEGATFYFDENGIPKVEINGEICYQPVFVSAYALNKYKDYLESNNSKDKKKFLKMADWFVENNKNGALQYPFEWKVGTIELKKGWTSSMAQGRALSVLSRAYYLTNNKKYLEAGNKILIFMITSAGRYLKDGTRKNLYDFANKYDEIRKYNSYYLFDTYIGIPSSYVLNGNLFALLGLYDWYRLGKDDYGSNIAKINFDNGIKAIELLLPYYDYYGWSSYGLNQYTNNDYIGLGNRYAHRCHLQLLYILYTKTNSEKFKYYVDRFLDYYQDDFWIQSDIIYQNVPRIKLDNGNEIMDVDNYYINGTTTGNRVEVFLNNKLIDTIIPNQKRFSYKINKFLLNDGWNYINFISFNVNNNYSSSNGAMINNINNQPDTFIPEEYIKQARIINSKLRGKYLLYDDYEYDKNYIGAGKLVENNNTRFDDDGIPMVKKEDKWYYNPVSISTQDLGLYKDYLANSSDVNKNAFLHVADYFVDNHEDGAFKYDINFKFQNVELTKGWTSAMAEGRALSVLARAYKITNDKKYANAGKIVLNYMISSADEDLLKGTSKII